MRLGIVWILALECMTQAWVGGWLSIDPLTKKYAGLSPYNFCADNPIINFDADGRDFIIFLEKQINTSGWQVMGGDGSGPFNAVNLERHSTNVSYVVIKAPGEDRFFYNTTVINWRRSHSANRRSS